MIVKGTLAEIVDHLWGGEPKEKAVSEEKLNLQDKFQAEMKKLSEAIGKRQDRVRTLEETERVLKAELETKKQEWLLLGEGKDKDIQRWREKSEQADKTIVMLKENEVRTLKEHEKQVGIQQSLYETYKEKATEELGTKTETITQLNQQLADARTELSEKQATITQMEENAHQAEQRFEFKLIEQETALQEQIKALTEEISERTD